ncbi:MAG: lipopolysaccharide biosynthesis protein, partial [Sphingobacteriales bacterium]
MDEVKKFLSIVRKYILALVIVPAVTIIIAFFLVRNAPDSFLSQSQIATGIVDETRQYQQQSLTNLGVLPNDQVNQEFSNLITMMKMKKMLDQVSYKLIIHDLTAEKPFRKPSQEIRYLNKSARAHALSVYRAKYAKKEALNLWDRDQNGIYNVLTSVGYDSESLIKNLNIYRAGSSDFINVEYESEDPTLSALVVNTLSAEFISYYSTIVRTNKVKAANFLNTLLKEKSDTLTKKMSTLRDYKIANRVLNLDEQSSQLYSSIVEYDTKKQEAIQNTSSYAGALNEIDRKFSPSERKYVEGALSKVNQDIVATKEELSGLYDLYYKSDFEERYKRSIDSLQAKLSAEINKSSDQYLTNPLTAKETLVQQKLDLEIKLDLSRYSINALENELSRLNSEFDQLVPKEAEVQSFEMSIDIATKEYLDILNRYNQSSLESEVPIKLNIVQPGMPGLPQPSKKMLLIILSGIISFMFVLAVLFIFFLLDSRIISAEGLANKTQLPVIGEIKAPDAPFL